MLEKGSLNNISSPSVHSFKHRIVRDLIWVIQSPPLISGKINDVDWWSHEWCLKEFLDCEDALLLLDKDPSDLDKHLSLIRNKRLGSYFEGLMSYWLIISPNFRAVQHNIQIIHNNHTYGEIDFIIEEIRTQKIIHLEVAVKFYLGTHPLNNSFRWYGTNTKDQLGKKYAHLADKQTQISQRHPEELKPYLKHQIDEKHCIIKGRLFYPLNFEVAPTDLPLSSNHLRGRWCYVQERDQSKSVIKIDKSNWLSCLNTEDINNLLSSEQSSIETIDRAECYVEVTRNEESIATEHNRIFYLPETFIFPD